MKFPKGTYSAFPTMLMKGRSPSEQVLLAWLIYHADDLGYCYPSYPLLAVETGMSERNLIRMTKKLEKEGTLIITRQNRMSNLYQIKGDKLSLIEDSRVTQCQSVSDTMSVGKGDKVAVESMNSFEPMNITNKKKVKKEIIQRYPAREEHFTIARYLYSLIVKNNEYAKEPKDHYQKWAKEIEEMERIDKVPIERIKKMCEWCQQDTFWKGVILSASNLRKHFVKMYAAAKKQYEEEKFQKEKEASNTYKVYGITV